jgi:hypothetical protein
MQPIVDPSRTHSLLQLLALVGASLDLHLAFCANCSDNSACQRLAGDAHRYASGSVDQDGYWNMRICVIAAGKHLELKRIVDVRLVTYRLTQMGKSLSDHDRELQFRGALVSAVDRMALLDE